MVIEVVNFMIKQRLCEDKAERKNGKLKLNYIFNEFMFMKYKIYGVLHN